MSECLWINDHGSQLISTKAAEACKHYTEDCYNNKQHLYTNRLIDPQHFSRDNLIIPDHLVLHCVSKERTIFQPVQRQCGSKFCSLYKMNDEILKTLLLQPTDENFAAD